MRRQLWHGIRFNASHPRIDKAQLRSPRPIITGVTSVASRRAISGVPEQLRRDPDRDPMIERPRPWRTRRSVVRDPASTPPTRRVVRLSRLPQRRAENPVLGSGTKLSRGAAVRPPALLDAARRIPGPSQRVAAAAEVRRPTVVVKHPRQRHTPRSRIVNGEIAPTAGILAILRTRPHRTATAHTALHRLCLRPATARLARTCAGRQRATPRRQKAPTDRARRLLHDRHSLSPERNGYG